jgi:hypothetical protein
MWIAVSRQWCESRAPAECKRVDQTLSAYKLHDCETPDATSSGRTRSEDNFRIADHLGVMTGCLDAKRRGEIDILSLNAFPTINDF